MALRKTSQTRSCEQSIFFARVSLFGCHTIDLRYHVAAKHVVVSGRHVVGHARVQDLDSIESDSSPGSEFRIRGLELGLGLATVGPWLHLWSPVQRPAWNSAKNGSSIFDLADSDCVLVFTHLCFAELYGTDPCCVALPRQSRLRAVRVYNMIVLTYSHT